MTDESTPPPQPSGSPRRILLGGCAAVLAVISAFGGFAWWLLTVVGGGADAGAEVRPADEPYRNVGDPALDDDGGPTRTEARALRADLRKIDRELEFARQQLRVSLDPGARRGWEERVSELEEQREAILARLRR